jgi:cytochrome c-type biogenesis protein CcmH/NrfF
MTMRTIILALIASLGLYAALTEEQETRIDFLQHRVLAPCCWQEPVADHRSEISLKMQMEIQEMVVAGKTDREILDHYKAQHGMRIFVEPEGTQFVVMNVVPFIFLGIGGIVVVFVLKHWLKGRPPESAEQEA